MMTRHLCVALVLACFAVTARAATPATIDKALNSAKDYIYKQQKDGNWEEGPPPKAKPIANVTRWIGRTIEHDLAFQIVDMKASFEDMLESPMLYISGYKPVKFTPADKAEIAHLTGTIDYKFTAGGGPADAITYRQFAVRNGVGHTDAPRLQGMTINGRLAVIYSREDLSVGLVGQAVGGIVGYSPATSTASMTRILNYASGAPSAPASKPAKG